VWLRQDKRRSQRVADVLEDEFGLGKWTPGRAGATRRPDTTRAEVERAWAAGRPTDREVLRRQVRAALAGAGSEIDWVGRMKGAGLLVAPHTAAEDPDRLVGHAVALRPTGKAKPTWYAGRTLDEDLSLPRIRARWPDQSPATAGEWSDAIPQNRSLTGGDRTTVWRSTAAALEAITGRLPGLPAGDPQWPAIARASADMLARVAATAEPSGSGPVSRAADILARAAAPRRSDPAPAASAIAAELGRVADALLVAGHARDAGEAAVLLAVVIQAARLIVALAELRAVQQQAHAAGVAAAARLMPADPTAAHPPTSAPRTPPTAAAPTRSAPESPEHTTTLNIESHHDTPRHNKVLLAWCSGIAEAGTDRLGYQSDRDEPTERNGGS
jgi:hypothetical protein